ncbi:hypothetical protein GIB67_009389 [Kingdonia uniflora]|uniref:Transposase n=1 Tax=Kingdonia uniflora TaxID=39325 RepID=A0A7J7N3B2_9MAGN|nr:hypothetical protein GIB67_009389 [Kingdonia uniflora]
MQHTNDAWKKHRSRVYKKYTKGKDPVKVKAVPPLFVPKEVWIEFVDMCNSDAFQTLGKDKKGHMMAMDIDITPSFVANRIHIVEENEDLKATNNELKTMLLNM